MTVIVSLAPPVPMSALNVTGSTVTSDWAAIELVSPGDEPGEIAPVAPTAFVMFPTAPVPESVPVSILKPVFAKLLVPSRNEPPRSVIGPAPETEAVLSIRVVPAWMSKVDGAEIVKGKAIWFPSLVLVSVPPFRFMELSVVFETSKVPPALTVTPVPEKVAVPEATEKPPLIAVAPLNVSVPPPLTVAVAPEATVTSEKLAVPPIASVAVPGKRHGHVEDRRVACRHDQGRGPVVRER